MSRADGLDTYVASTFVEEHHKPTQNKPTQNSRRWRMKPHHKFKEQMAASSGRLLGAVDPGSGIGHADEPSLLWPLRSSMLSTSTTASSISGEDTPRCSSNSSDIELHGHPSADSVLAKAPVHEKTQAEADGLLQRTLLTIAACSRTTTDSARCSAGTLPPAIVTFKSPNGATRASNQTSQQNRNRPGRGSHRAESPVKGGRLESRTSRCCSDLRADLRRKGNAMLQEMTAAEKASAPACAAPLTAAASMVRHMYAASAAETSMNTEVAAEAYLAATGGCVNSWSPAAMEPMKVDIYGLQSMGFGTNSCLHSEFRVSACHATARALC